MERNNEMKTTKKRLIAIALIALFSLSSPIEKADAQIFIMSEDEFLNSERNRITDGGLPFTPTLDVTIDQYAPLGGGIWVLGCLGGAYLLGKRKKRKE